jgi:ribonuclease R
MPGAKKKRARRDDEIRGTYVGHPRGFGFLVREGGGADLFVPPRNDGGAIDGDTVIAEPVEGDAARVTRIVRRGRALLAGTYFGQGTFAADAHRVPGNLPVEGKARKGDKVVVAATEKGFRIRRVLGRAGAPDVEDAAVLAELEISPRFPKGVLAEARKLPPPGAADLRGRMDLRDATTVVTVDPVTSRDFDDAISIERRGDERRLGVHIADVSHYVLPDSAIDREAYRRGTSVYLPNRVIPMLPEELSNDLCSLREGEDRLTLSVLLRFDAKGNLLETTFAESVIRSVRCLSYERASRVMDRTVKERGPVGDLLLEMAKLAETLRRNRPSLDLPREEIEFIYNGRGDVVDVRPTALDVAHGVIEEFMLAANREVARLLLGRRAAAIYRHHPEPEDLSGVWEALRELGAVRAGERGRRGRGGRREGAGASPGPRDLGESIARAVAKGYGPAVSAAMLRCLPRAFYTTGAASHYSLGFEAYTHFTSPIRRYSDLVVHRLVRSAIRARRDRGPLRQRTRAKLPAPQPDDALESVAEHVTAKAAASDRAESRIRRRRVLEFLLRRGRVPTDGQVTMVVERGLVVDLPEFATSGFLATDLLPGGPFEAQRGALRGRRRAYHLGDALEVCIHRIDPSTGQLDVALAGG